jgi:aryl carrier-like protein
LGEIESVLGELPSVRECAVLAREDVPGDKRLVAYVIPSNGKVASNELRNYLSGRLPEYMIPQHWVTLESLPLTANGKVDRLALPAPETERSEFEESYVAPRNDVERLLAEIWQQVFGLQRVGVHDNFFELGGDSIRSIQVIARAKRQGLRLTPKLLFQHQTISELAAESEIQATPIDEGTVKDFPHARVNQNDLNLLMASMSRASESKP